MDGNTRRLPPWMLAGASSATSNRREEGEIKQEAEEAPKTKKKRKIRKERDDDSDREETKKVEIRRRGGVRRKIKEEEAKPSSIDDRKSPEIIRSANCSEDEENLTVDDLLSFAHEYVKGEEEDGQANEITLVDDVNDESDMRSSKGETNGTRDPTSEDMINLLLGPFFKKSCTN